jgi:catechol 2,3-dioxygenase-like lactoylglutathione lyase family enzyme
MSAMTWLEKGGCDMGFVGIEEIFLDVQDLDKAIDFYHNKLGIPLDMHNGPPDQTAHRATPGRWAIPLCVYGHRGHL